MVVVVSNGQVRVGPTPNTCPAPSWCTFLDTWTPSLSTLVGGIGKVSGTSCQLPTDYLPNTLLLCLPGPSHE